MTPDDEVEVELIGVSSTETAEVRLRPRGRRRELLLVIASVAVVAGVGLLGGGSGDDDEAAAAPTTTTTERRTTTTRRPGPSTTTTTTSWPQRETGTGPILPGAVPGTFLGVVDSGGVVTIVDLGTGDRCHTRPGGGGAHLPWNLPDPVDELIVQSDVSLLAVGRACAVGPLGIPFGAGWPATSTREVIWVMEGDTAQELREIAYPSGEPTGRTVELPAYTWPTVVAAGDRLVISLNGEMTLLDPSTDRRVALGDGMPVAAHGDVVAFVGCPELRCRLGFLDVGSGRRRYVDGVEPLTVEQQPKFSDDGRLLLVTVDRDSPAHTTSAVVDVARAEVVMLEDSLHSTVLSADGRWLFGVHRGDVAAVAVDGRSPRIDLWLGRDFNGVQGLAAFAPRR